jgi:pantoate--beta-alanine ligase
MHIFQSISVTKAFLKTIKDQKGTIGFVPTMGALHKGHLSLLAETRRNNDFVACSVFVNPIQFNNKSDLENYPRDIQRDIQLLESAGCDFLFQPTEAEMYPEPVTETFDFGNLDKVMEGKFRPGHFIGVAVVVKRLLEIMEPDRTYFGLKDFQQLAIIQRMVKDYNIPVEIIPCSTVREDDGLAMSSRNQLLTKEDRTQATIIYEALKRVKVQSGSLRIKEIKNQIQDLFNNTRNAKLEYFEIVDMDTLEPILSWTESKRVIACIAVYFGKVRLIDNIILFS